MVTPPHWPQGRTGVGASLSDFTELATSDPHFDQAWGEINGQLDIEGAGTTEINSAKIALTNAFEQLSTQSFGLSGQDAINAAKQYVLVGQTVLGAVQTVGGLVGQLENGAPPLEVMQAFTGTLIGLAAGAGLISAGVGAAIVAGVGAILDILGSVGLFGSPPPGVGVPGCNYSVPSQPDFQFGCIVAWGPKVEPTSTQWRKFPQPGNPPDEPWFQPIPNTSTVYGDWPQIPNGPPPIRLGGPAPAGRPIDTGFPAYQRALNDSSNGGFFLAFFQAWQSNAEYALNGLRPQPDEQVLIHTLRLWNRAHDGPMVPLRGGFYAESLVPLAMNTLSGNDPLMFAGGLGINVGPIKSPPRKVIALHLPSGSIKASPTLPGATSTGAKVAAGTAVVGGAAILGTVVFSLVKGQAVDAVLGHAWKHVKGWFR